ERDFRRLRLRAGEHIDRLAGPVGIGNAADRTQRRRNAAGGGVPFEHARVADQNRIAGDANRAIACSLEADLRPEAGRSSRCNRDDRFFAPHVASADYFHGIRETWITSLAPSPPTDLIARSASLRPNVCVVTSSSGKRFEASCCNASSHAR